MKGYYIDVVNGPRHRGAVQRWLWSVRLFFAIVYRMNQGDYRTGPGLAWSIARDIHSECVCYKCKPLECGEGWSS